MNIIQLIHKFNIKHCIYASASRWYGCASKVPLNEDDQTDKPESIYAATKKSNELIAHVFGSQLNLPVTGLRFFTVYGPYGRPDMAPALFKNAILEGKEINIFNNGDLSRDFSYIDDIVRGVVKFIDSEPTKKISIYNICNAILVTLIDFKSTCVAALGWLALNK